jgi:diguanylate cyclase (GGDEF)-like protein
MLSILTGQEIFTRRLQGDTGFSVAVLCINIARFRRINKTWGIKSANDTLKIVAQRLSAVKGLHDLLAHSFEDEFVMVSVGCDAVQALAMGRRIQAALGLPLTIDKTEIILSANIGVSMSPDNALDGDLSRIIEEARSVLFRMRRGEQSQIHFFSSLPEHFSEADLVLEARLLHAIEQGKLHLCYQPQISLKNGGIHGVEALCRWQEEDLGAITPKRFIPLAEEAGLIDQLSEWVLHEVCRQLSDWRRRNIPVPVVAVNLSAMNFRDEELPGKIMRCLEAYALEPKDLTLELTETALLDDDPITLSTLRKTREYGLMLSLDDFGTGYSSLGYLRNLPISEMKLDRSFVQDLHENDISRRLSKAIIRVGESLDLCVLAEGVENQHQLDLLKQHHYQVVQGFFLAEPLLPSALEHWLEAWKPAKIF